MQPLNKKIYFICSHEDKDKLSAEIKPDGFVSSGTVYIMSENISLEDYAQTYKNKVSELEKRYAYLERGRSWVIKNFRAAIKEK